MDLGNEPIKLKESEYRALTKLIYDKSGINLGNNKQELVKTRLAKRLRALNLKSYMAYYEHLLNSAEDGELMLMINAISTNFTSFFREGQHFEFLTGRALPEIMARKGRGNRKLRAWCAASSTGEEPYTLALILKEFFEPHPEWDVKLLATDISTKVLLEAMEGRYNGEKLKQVRSDLRQKYFVQQGLGDSKFYEVGPDLKRLVTFRRLNLMDKMFPFQGPFDFISCRNVMIYFDPPTQEAVVGKLMKYLDVGGFLLIGHSENLPASFRTRVEVLAPATYRKIK